VGDFTGCGPTPLDRQASAEGMGTVPDICVGIRAHEPSVIGA
jgi:hypothetical protein